mmetsp:Transcript_7969/g.24014  ORF Transcript_7969/g.24014 Transcript_7969/m.24014 type:complete len:363 (+) Transcript_7969:77-1165(+)
MASRSLRKENSGERRDSTGKVEASIASVFRKTRAALRLSAPSRSQDVDEEVDVGPGASGATGAGESRGILYGGRSAYVLRENIGFAEPGTSDSYRDVFAVNGSPAPRMSPQLQEPDAAENGAAGDANGHFQIRRSAVRRSSFENAESTYYRPVWGRRYSWRGPLRRGLFRRQRWMFSDYDWSMHDFDRSYLWNSMPQHVRLLEYFDDLTYEEMLALEEHMGKVTKGISKEDLAKIPIERIESTHGKKTDEERTCTICLESFERGAMARKLMCNHFFHVDCVDSWLHENKMCPVCKTEVLQNYQSAEAKADGQNRGENEVCSEDKEEEIAVEELRHEMESFRASSMDPAVGLDRHPVEDDRIS